MSIATRTGDDGSTGLMYGRRVPKNYVRVEAYGTVDELNATLGFARAHLTADAFFLPTLLAIQTDLVALMGELATAGGDRDRYVKDDYPLISEDSIQKIDALILVFEKEKSLQYKGWATPGGTLAAGAFDVARTVCRRAERRFKDLEDAEGSQSKESASYLNRLSDLLWLCARWAEAPE